MAQKAAIKSRIKSINTTKKITGAMELIASAKLQKLRNMMFKNREYASILKDTMNSILSRDVDVESPYLKKNNSNSRVVIIFCSDLGLCGGYNINVIKKYEEINKDDDKLIVVGTSEYSYFKRNHNVINELTDSDNITYIELKKLSDLALDMYLKNEIGVIEVIYTRFVNNVTFKAESEIVLPCETNAEEKKEYKEVLLEPNPNDILNNLIPMVIENEIYSKWLESKTAEQGSRRFAMENATDNAEELTEELLLAFNQARQAAITQEITEIVSGADAL